MRAGGGGGLRSPQAPPPMDPHLPTTLPAKFITEAAGRYSTRCKLISDCGQHSSCFAPFVPYPAPLRTHFVEIVGRNCRSRPPHIQDPGGTVNHSTPHYREQGETRMCIAEQTVDLTHHILFCFRRGVLQHYLYFVKKLPCAKFELPSR